MLDRAVAGFGAAITFAGLISRWEDLKGQPYSLASRLTLILLFSLIFLYCTLAPERYEGHRPLVIAMLKSLPLVLGPESKLQVRLNHPPTGRLGADLFNAVVGLRFANMVLGGLWWQPWWLWTLQQAALVGVGANFEVDCSTPLLSHPLMAERISKLNTVLHAMTLPQLHREPGWLLPSTQIDQCKVAVAFLAPLFGIFIPGLLLVPPLRQPRVRATRSSGSWMDRCIEWLLRILRFQGGERWVPEWSLLAWWGLLALLWVGSAMSVLWMQLDARVYSWPWLFLYACASYESIVPREVARTARASS